MCVSTVYSNMYLEYILKVVSVWTKVVHILMLPLPENNPLQGEENVYSITQFILQHDFSSADCNVAKTIFVILAIRLNNVHCNFGKLL